MLERRALNRPPFVARHTVPVRFRRSEVPSFRSAELNLTMPQQKPRTQELKPLNQERKPMNPELK